jgi:hypothetical protein
MMMMMMMMMIIIIIKKLFASSAEKFNKHHFQLERLQICCPLMQCQSARAVLIGHCVIRTVVKSSLALLSRHQMWSCPVFHVLPEDTSRETNCVPHKTLDSTFTFNALCHLQEHHFLLTVRIMWSFVRLFRGW